MKHVGQLFLWDVLALGVAVCSLLLLNTAHASPVTINFSGLVSSMKDSSSASVLEQQVRGSSSVIAVHPIGGMYTSMASGFSLKFDDTSSSATFAPGPFRSSQVQGATVIGKDSWKPGMSVIETPINWFDQRELKLGVQDKNMFLNESLQPPNLGTALSKVSWRLNFEESDEEHARVKSGFSQLTAVPLPAAVVLLSAGLISLVGLGAGGLRNLRKAQV